MEQYELFDLYQQHWELISKWDEILGDREPGARQSKMGHSDFLIDKIAGAFFLLRFFDAIIHALQGINTGMFTTTNQYTSLLSQRRTNSYPKGKVYSNVSTARHCSVQSWNKNLKIVSIFYLLVLSNYWSNSIQTKYF